MMGARRWQQLSLAIGCTIGLAVSLLASRSFAADLQLRIVRTAGTANGEVLVIPDCATSPLKISPCGRVARSWVNHLNARAVSFVDGYRAAGYSDTVTSVKLDCSAGILAKRKSRQGQRKQPARLR